MNKHAKNYQFKTKVGQPFAWLATFQKPIFLQTKCFHPKEGSDLPSLVYFQTPQPLIHLSGSRDWISSRIDGGGFGGLSSRDISRGLILGSSLTGGTTSSAGGARLVTSRASATVALASVPAVWAVGSTGWADETTAGGSVVAWIAQSAAGSSRSTGPLEMTSAWDTSLGNP